MLLNSIHAASVSSSFRLASASAFLLVTSTICVAQVPEDINLRESLSSVNTATGNMADETEALKHNFFFRAFFRKRGYYNLTHLSPDLYRKDRLFAATGNRRCWFKASDLFRRNSDGTEYLTPQGRSLLNSELAEYGGTIIQAPIVIEGYCDVANRADRLAIFRARSLFVRNYVQKHFQLDPSQIGAVALEDRPPAGLGYTTWDGVTIVLLKAKH